VFVAELETSRRNLIGGLAAAGIALPVLAACGSSSDSGATATVPSSGTSPTTSGGTSGGGAAGSGGGIPASDIPVGGGKIFKSQEIVVTQPKAGEFKAFTAICTHAGCPLTGIASGAIECPCHGSTFSIVDGSVEGGPAPSPLQELKVTMTGNTLQVT
jgi:Rieske Fe-S protein